MLWLEIIGNHLILWFACKQMCENNIMMAILAYICMSVRNFGGYKIGGCEEDYQI